MNQKNTARKIRHKRIRMRLSGTAAKPRLVVFRSLKYNYIQLIDDESRKVLLSISNMKEEKKETKTENAKKIGVEMAKKAVEKGIMDCVFDRNGYKYHGRVKAIADGAREGGLKF